MTLFLDDGDVRLYHGDVVEQLAVLHDGSVDCVVSSPPYWGLRSYLDADHKDKPLELGLEETPDAYVARMVEVFRQVRRVLAPHGTCWVNLGDTYNSRLDGSHGGWNGSSPEPQTVDERGPTNRWQGTQRRLAQKNLIGIPWRVAFALQDDGWILRADIIWAKPNPMPESVTDRPTKAHEYVFLLSKQPRYYFDAEAVREKFEARPQQRLTANVDMPLGKARIAAGVQQGNPQGGTHVSPFAVQDETLDYEMECLYCGCAQISPGPCYACGREVAPIRREPNRGPDGRRVTKVVGRDGSEQHRDGERWPNPTGRNIRSVWTVATQPYPEAHFATYPEELVRRCILAGCPEGGTVLDPFVGSGTTCKVARDHGRHSIGIDLSADYLELAAKRLQQLSLLTQEGAA